MYYGQKSTSPLNEHHNPIYTSQVNTQPYSYQFNDWYRVREGSCIYNVTPISSGSQFYFCHFLMRNIPFVFLKI